MAFKWSYAFCFLRISILVACEQLDGTEFYLNGREWERLSHLMDPPIHNNRFEGYNKEDSGERRNSSRTIRTQSSTFDDVPPDYERHWALYRTVDDQYYGTKAKINLWGHPNLKPHQKNAAAIWIMNHEKTPNFIIAGFQVYPGLYNDNKLHFFTFWTADNYNLTGCFNLRCKGFVVVNWNILTPGDVIEPVSTYNGDQYFITISVKKDPRTGNWLLSREDLGAPQLIGYWPKSLFTTLANRATLIAWGGFVGYSRKETGPPMGSGHDASELAKKAAYIKNIKLFDSKGSSYDLIDGKCYSFTTAANFYKVTKLVNSGKYGFHDGYLFYYGGPGGCI